MVITMNLIKISELNRYKAFGVFAVISIFLFFALSLLVGVVYAILRDTDLVNQFVLAVQLYWGFVKGFLFMLCVLSGLLSYSYRKRNLVEVSIGAMSISMLTGALFFISLFA